MPSDPYLIERIRRTLSDRKITWREINMFGGNCFMVDDKMCLGTYKGGLMARVGPEELPGLQNHNIASQMIHGGRPMKGYLFIEPEGYDNDTDLELWIDKCLGFNPKAKASKKKD